MEFSQYKSNAMKKLEHALSEGLVDEGVISVIKSFNSHPDIFTTSSCAGRIQFIILPDIGRKDSVQRRKTWHREVTVDDVEGAISEFDIAFAYSLPVDVNQMAIDVGLINYNYPGNGDSSNPSTTELFLSSTILSFQNLFTPSITMYADIQEYPGVYFLFDIFAPSNASNNLSPSNPTNA